MSWCKPVVSIHPVSSYRRLKGFCAYFGPFLTLHISKTDEWNSLKSFEHGYLVGDHCLAPVSAPFVKVTKVPFLGSSIHRLSLW